MDAEKKKKLLGLLLETGKSDIKSARHTMLTEHQHKENGYVVMDIVDYDNLIDVYEYFIESFKELVIDE